MDTQIKPITVANPRQVTEPARTQACPEGVQEPGYALGVTLSRPKLSARVVAVLCSFGVLAGSA